MIGLVFWIGVGIVAYTYVGYPLFVVALSRVVLRKRPAPGGLPTVTLIIAAYNEQAVIGRKVAESLALDYPPDRLRIVVAADGSNDATVHIVQAFDDPRLRVLHRPERLGKMAALERAVQESEGDIIVFSDANNRYAPDAIRKLVGSFRDPSVGMVTGRKTVETDDGLGYSEGLYWRYESAIRVAETSLGIGVAWNGEIMAVRRSLFRPAPRGFVNDDAWIALGVLSAGHRIVYEPMAVSIETVSMTAAEENERRTRMFAGIWQMYAPRLVRVLPWRHPATWWALVSHKMMRPLVPAGFALAAGATAAALVAAPDSDWLGGLGALASPWAAVAAIGQILLYGAAIVGPRLGGRIARVAYVPRFLLDANIAAVRGLSRQLRGGQSVIWQKAERTATESTEVHR